MTVDEFKKLEEGMKILINDRPHLITMKTGYMLRPDNNWRFMPIDIPKKERRGYNELYVAFDEGLKNFLMSKRIKLIGKNEQLTLF